MILFINHHYQSNYEIITNCYMFFTKGETKFYALPSPDEEDCFGEGLPLIYIYAFSLWIIYNILFDKLFKVLLVIIFTS